MVSLHHQWKGTRLLSPETECTKYLLSWQMKLDFGSWKMKTFHKNLKIECKYSLMLSLPYRNKNLAISLENWKNEVLHFPQKSYFNYFVNLSRMICEGLQFYLMSASYLWTNMMFTEQSQITKYLTQTNTSCNIQKLLTPF